MRTAALLVAGSALAIAACEIMPGVSRTAALEPMPSPDCLMDAVRAVDGVTDVTYAAGEISTSWLFPDWRPDTLHTITYNYEGIENTLRFHESADGSATFSQGYRGASQEVVDTVYPTWLEVEKSLENRCGITGLASKVTETCLNVECPQEWKPARAVSEYLDALRAGGQAQTLVLIHPDGLESAKRLMLAEPRFHDGVVLGATTLDDSIAFSVVLSSADESDVPEPDKLAFIRVKQYGEEWMIAEVTTLELALQPSGEVDPNGEVDEETKEMRAQLRERLQQRLQESN